MGQGLKRFLEKQGAWKDVNPAIQKQIEDGIHAGWDGRIIRNILKAGSSGQPVNLSSVVSSTIGNKDPKAPPPPNPNQNQNQNQNQGRNQNPNRNSINGNGSGNGNGNGNNQKQNGRPQPQQQVQNLPTKKKGRFGSLSFKNLKVVGIGVLVLVALAVGAYFYFNSQPSVTPDATLNPQAQSTQTAQAPEFVMPAAPTPNAIDIANAKWLSPVQIIIAVMAALVILGLFLDARERGQVSDAWLTMIGIFLVMGVGIFVTLFKGALEPRFTESDTVWIVSLVLTIVAFALVLYAVFSDGFDATPLGSFLTMLAVGVLFLGTVGALQNLLGFSSSPVVPLNQLWVYLQLKKVDLIWSSLFCYIALIAGIAIFGEEIIRTTLQIHKTGEKFYSAFASVAGLIAYAALRLLAPTWPYLATFGTALAVAVIAATMHPEFGTTGGAMGEGEKRIRGGLIPPWDKVSFQLTIGLLLIALTGMI